MTEVDDTFFARRLGQLIAEKMIDPHRELAFAVRVEMEEKLPDDVKGCIGPSHIAFGAACAYYAYEKLAEHNAVFEMQWKASQRGIKAWQEAHPGHDLTWPDQSDMITWLMEKAFPDHGGDNDR